MGQRSVPRAPNLGSHPAPPRPGLVMCEGCKEAVSSRRPLCLSHLLLGPKGSTGAYKSWWH